MTFEVRGQAADAGEGDDPGGPPGGARQATPPTPPSERGSQRERERDREGVGVQGPGGGRRVGCSGPTPAVERIWHVQDSIGQIMALAFRYKSTKPTKWFFLRSEAASYVSVYLVSSLE